MDPILSLVILGGLAGAGMWAKKKSDKITVHKYAEKIESHVADMRTVEDASIEAIATWSNEKIQELSTSIIEFQGIIEKEKNAAESGEKFHAVVRADYNLARNRAEQAEEKLESAVYEKRKNE